MRALSRGRSRFPSWGRAFCVWNQMGIAWRRAIRQALASRQAHRAVQCSGSSRSCVGHSGNRPTALQGFVQRYATGFLHRRENFQATGSHVHPSILHGEALREQLQSMKNRNAKNRLRLEGICPPEGQVSAEDARRLVRFVRLEALKARLSEIPSGCISYGELLRLCTESVCNSSEEEARGIATLLDESGQILVLGQTVYLRPHQVARAIEDAIPLSVLPQDDPRREELQRMEKQKDEIDVKAERLVRRELWSGLGFLSIQTLGFMRLTFWEFSWDVMEPICFFVTSIYFIAGYAFFLRTSRNPTLEGFFQARLETRQSRLMKKKKFDVERFRELQRICKLRLKPSRARGTLDALEDY